jgi:quercetin dioxygenase-like cupin family protein
MRMSKSLMAAALSGIALFAIAVPTAFAEDAKPAKITPVFGEKLPNVPGSSITGILVEYEPGGKTAAHRHAGSVMAYVLSGAIRSENSATGPVRVYKAGESFFEPAGSIHLVSENASTTEPASLLAIFVAEDGATLTTPGK